MEVLDAEGRALPVGESGIRAARAPDPVFMLAYWNYLEATRANFRGDWWMTGDVGWKDSDGFIWFKGRDDDVISSAGYRVGPG